MICGNTTGIIPFLSGMPLPTKNKLFLSFTEIFHRPSQNSLSAMSFFPDFCSIDRSPVLMHHRLLLIIVGGTKGADSGGALVPLRSGLVQTGCQKSEKRQQTSQTSARAALRKRKKQ